MDDLVPVSALPGVLDRQVKIVVDFLDPLSRLIIDNEAAVPACVANNKASRDVPLRSYL